MRRALALLLLLSGCAVGPDYKRPDTPPAPAFKETPPAWKNAEPGDALGKGRWWEMFGDPELSALVEKIEGANFSLAAAEAQFRQAQAAVAIARAPLLPSIDFSGSAVRNRSPSGVIGGTTAGRTVTTRAASFSANWEADFWGHIRRQVEAAEASLEASEASYASARLSLQSQLMTAYFQLRTIDLQKRLLDETVDALRKSLELTNNRYNVGVAAKADVVQADAQLKSTLVQAVDLGVQRAQLEHAIAVLTGVSPAELAIAPNFTYQAQLPAVPPGLPSELLERRPDVAQAERNMAAANAQIGVVKSALFPTVTLSGQYGWRTADPTIGLLNVANRFWSLGPSVAYNVFDFGLRRAQTEQAIAAYDAQVANYRQAVLTAFGNVEDNLAALRILEEEAAAERDAVDAARLSLELTINQYKAGTVSYLNVVT
ncbi:MAG: efflux transporter outer membrane subunit, partial [Betaproteobacteria bacterium]|nr:efflux transporter outer membrane subunit [Betaproteobacteria bacterium]